MNLIKELDDKGVQSIEAQTAAALEWSEKVQEAWDATLLSKGKISGSSRSSRSLVLTHSTVGGQVLTFPVRRFNLSVGQEACPLIGRCLTRVWRTSTKDGICVEKLVGLCLARIASSEQLKSSKHVATKISDLIPRDNIVDCMFTKRSQCRQ